jgi:hypothetical protein
MSFISKACSALPKEIPTNEWVFQFDGSAADGPIKQLVEDMGFHMPSFQSLSRSPSGDKHLYHVKHKMSVEELSQQKQ